MSPFLYSDDNKRYHTLSYHNRQLGVKRHKAAVDAGLTCPNKDGRCGTGGCIYCASGGSYFTHGGKSVTQQLLAERVRIHQKFPGSGLVAYFQAGTNTYAPVETLQRLFEEALRCPDVEALSVATRADCVEEDVCRLLEDLARRVPVRVELGLQSAKDETARRIGRGHDWAAFLQGYARLKAHGLPCCIHLINGLPGEGLPDMLETARQVARLRPEGVKIHSLHVVEGTRLAELWRQGAYTPLSLEKYVQSVVGQLERLPPETVIERITGDADRTRLLAPRWSADKKKVLAAIDRQLAAEDTWQGRLFDP